MKPVYKGASPGLYSHYDQAKIDLIERLGQHCSYCERFKDVGDLHVEHIYPKRSHKSREHDWDNFLLACNVCNSKKNNNLGHGRQRRLYERFIWPHRDNTALAFKYYSDGRVEENRNLSQQTRLLTINTIKMLGLLTRQTKAKKYEARAIAVSGIKIREEIWQEIESLRTDYKKNRNRMLAREMAKKAVQRGHFSIWMAVFSNFPEFRNELITAFKADRRRFDVNARAVRGGRIT